VHEAAPAAYFDGPAALGFLFSLAVRRLASAPGALIWIAAGAAGFDFGEPYGPGLAGVGLDPQRLRIVRVRETAQVLSAAEEAARLPGLGVVVCALGPAIDGGAARRLQLACEAGAALCLVWRPVRSAPLAGARTRWRIAAASSPRPTWAEEAGLQGRAVPPGDAAWRAELLRGRNGAETFTLEWAHATHGFRLADPVADRSLAASGARLNVA
jgi:protein ImuA